MSWPAPRLAAVALALAGALNCCFAQATPPAAKPATAFKVLALAERGGHHLAFTTAAKPWLKQCGEELGFEIDYLHDTTKMGDHPVVWTNEHLAARNVYIFMGHGPDLLENPAYTTLLRNAIVWAAGR